MLRAFADPLLSVLFPQQCGSCSNELEKSDLGVACGECWQATRIFNGNEMLCDKCGAFFSDTAAPVPVLCHKCDDHKYDKTFAAGVYEKALSANILALKQQPKIPFRLKRVIKDSIDRIADAPNVIIPIPLSKMRELERGFNQAAMIASIVGDHLGVAVDSFSLSRTTHTPVHRIGMDQRARELTVQKAFKVDRPKFVRGKSILLVDDVLTSGSTASACAAVLKRAGVKRVDVFTIARAVMR